MDRKKNLGIHVDIDIDIDIDIDVDIFIFICMYVCMYVCIYIYIRGLGSPESGRGLTPSRGSTADAGITAVNGYIR